MLAASAAGASKIFLSEPNKVRRELVESWKVCTGIYDPLSQDVAALVKGQTESNVGVGRRH